MAPRRKKKTPRKRTFQPLPQNTCWVESDSYDRHSYAKIRSESPSLQSLEETGSTFLPHFASLLQDLFCLLFKFNVVFFPEKDVLPSALFNRTVLNGLQQGHLYRILRELTRLDEAKAGLCTLLLGEGVIALLKSEKTLTLRDMLDLWDVKKQQEVVEQKRE